MGTFKKFATAAVDAADKMAEKSKKESELAQELVNRGYGIDYMQAKKVAKVLIRDANLTWK